PASGEPRRGLRSAAAVELLTSFCLCFLKKPVRQDGVYGAVTFLLGDQYAYRLEPGKTLKDYNIEQQGDIVRDYFLEKNEFGEASANSRFAGVLKNFPTGY
ncbi:hypothetical protein ABZQ95_32690, partial [Pseudomonas aeruginosa]